MDLFTSEFLLFIVVICVFFLPCLIVPFIFAIPDIIKALITDPIASARHRRIEKCKSSVAQVSVWYHAVEALNEETKFYTEILDNGATKYMKDVDSKPKYDRMTPEQVLYDYLSVYRTEILRALEQVRRNRVIFEVYDKKFHSLSSSATEKQAKELGMKYKKLLEYEQLAVSEIKLDIIHEYFITCGVTYTSPAGVNSYRKAYRFGEEKIEETIQKIFTDEAFRETEAWRRKSERRKVTASLRYDVMQRDGFRCCLCGRSAKNGVELEVDHIIPVSQGGCSDMDNLQTLCFDCNRGKAAKMK